MLRALIFDLYVPMLLAAAVPWARAAPTMMPQEHGRSHRSCAALLPSPGPLQSGAKNKTLMDSREPFYNHTLQHRAAPLQGRAVSVEVE